MRKLACGVMVWLHVLLLSAAPLLHAHAAEPVADPSGVHFFLPSDSFTQTTCAIAAETTPIFTAEVVEGRGLNDVDTNTLVPWTCGNFMAPNEVRKVAFSRLTELAVVPPGFVCHSRRPQGP